MRIAIVNDVPMAAEALRRAVLTLKHCEIAWTAADGVEAVEACLRDTPDLILMDLIMPRMNGVQATREIMRQCPCAILVVTLSVNQHAEMVFEAMGAGALDAVDTPVLSGSEYENVSGPLLAKLGFMSRLLGLPANQIPQGIDRRLHLPTTPLVVIGASAGGPAALAEVLGALPTDFPAPIVVIQHVDEQFAPLLVGWMKRQTTLPVRGARVGDSPKPGEVLMADKGEHLLLLGSRRLVYRAEPEDAFYRPSVDIFFESVAERWPGEVVGVLLTGMGRDGAKGLKRLREAGFHTIAQDQASSAVYGMPKAAAEIGAAVEVLPLNAIAGALCKRFSNSKSRPCP